jgi:hypothetical protein
MPLVENSAARASTLHIIGAAPMLRSGRGGMQMSRHSRNLLVLAIAAALAPLSPAQAPAAAEPIRHDSDCPYARAELAAAEREAAAGMPIRLAEASTAAVSVFGVAPELIP